jgi:hypothetical protein
VINVWLGIWAILDFAGVNHEPPPENTEVVEVVCEFFQDDCVRALGVAWCESLHNPRAYNGVDHGLFQINEHYWGHVFKKHWPKRYEIVQSSWFAHYIHENTRGGWRLWTCGRYK